MPQKKYVSIRIILVVNEKNMKLFLNVRIFVGWLT